MRALASTTWAFGVRDRSGSRFGPGLGPAAAIPVAILPSWPSAPRHPLSGL